MITKMTEYHTINADYVLPEWLEDWTVHGTPKDGYMPDGSYSNPVTLQYWDGAFVRLMQLSMGFKRWIIKKKLKAPIKSLNKALLRKMPKYTGRYSKDKKAEDETWYTVHKNLKYHYTSNPKSIRRRTKTNYPQIMKKGKNKGLIIVKWRSSAPHYNWLRWGYGRNGKKIYEGAEWTKWWEQQINVFQNWVGGNQKKWFFEYSEFVADAWKNNTVSDEKCQQAAEYIKQAFIEGGMMQSEVMVSWR